MCSAFQIKDEKIVVLLVPLVLYQRSVQELDPRGPGPSAGMRSCSGGSKCITYLPDSQRHCLRAVQVRSLCALMICPAHWCTGHFSFSFPSAMCVWFVRPKQVSCHVCQQGQHFVWVACFSARPALYLHLKLVFPLCVTCACMCHCLFFWTSLILVSTVQHILSSDGLMTSTFENKIVACKHWGTVRWVEACVWSV